MTDVIARSRGPKLAASVADRIVADIKDLGWPEDTVLGSETELLERYGVSRAVFREAVRLVEHQQVARMRRGPGGGLVIAAPSTESVVDAVAIYLLSANARVEHVAQVRLALEDTVAELAPRRLTEGDIVALRELAERERADASTDLRELHTMLASMTRNPALAFCVDLLTRITQMYSPSRKAIKPEVREASHRAHVAIIDAAIAGNEGLTVHRMHKHIAAELEFLGHSQRLLDPKLLRTLEKSDKRGERLAREIFLEVREAGWPEGELLGSESELMERFGVSRAVLREAVRLLEHHQIAAMRRGPGGGLFVTRPGVEATVGAVTLLTGASIGILGTMLGLLIGVLFCVYIEEIRQFIQLLTATELFPAEIYFLSRIPAKVDWTEVATIVIMALGLTFLATLYPAWRASRVEPAEALRYE